MKTLFIQIDNTPLSSTGSEYITYDLDCRQINDFLTFVVYAIVDGLKDKNGMPYYRLFSNEELIDIIAGFQKENEQDYNLIIDQWLTILGEILHKGAAKTNEECVISVPQTVIDNYSQNKDKPSFDPKACLDKILNSKLVEHRVCSLRLPESYMNWLLTNDNEYYQNIGELLKLKERQLNLDAEGLVEDIISILHLKVNQSLQQHPGIDFVVFSNPLINNSSLLVHQLVNTSNIKLMNANQFNEFADEDYKKKCLQLEDHRAFKIDQYVLGVTPRTCLTRGYAGNATFMLYKEISLYAYSSVLDKIEARSNNEGFNILLSILYGKNVENENLNFYDIYSNIILRHSFKEISEPSIDGEYWFKAIYIKENHHYKCKIRFIEKMYYNHNLSEARLKKNTLYAIDIELKS